MFKSKGDDKNICKRIVLLDPFYNVNHSPPSILSCLSLGTPTRNEFLSAANPSSLITPSYHSSGQREGSRVLLQYSQNELYSVTCMETRIVIVLG